MHKLTLAQSADYLEAAHVAQTINHECFAINIGTNDAGERFVMVNDCWGRTFVVEALMDGDTHLIAKMKDN